MKLFVWVYLDSRDIKEWEKPAHGWNLQKKCDYDTPYSAARTCGHAVRPRCHALRIRHMVRQQGPALRLLHADLCWGCWVVKSCKISITQHNAANTIKYKKKKKIMVKWILLSNYWTKKKCYIFDKRVGGEPKIALYENTVRRIQNLE